MRLIFQDEFLLVDIPFASNVKFYPLGQFPVDHICYPVVPSIEYILYKLAAFTLYVINRFICFT